MCSALSTLERNLQQAAHVDKVPWSQPATVNVSTLGKLARLSFSSVVSAISTIE